MTQLSLLHCLNMFLVTLLQISLIMELIFVIIAIVNAINAFLSRGDEAKSSIQAWTSIGMSNAETFR